MPYRGWNIISEARAKGDIRVLDEGLVHWHEKISLNLEELLAAAEKLQRSMEGVPLQTPFDETALRALRASMHQLEDEIPVLATLQFAYPHLSEELGGQT